ncbi:hypothetical protein [Lacrimispora sp.]|uniref:hypothetical protein n=1 Tax=Lacrimispora sp. TaxID=2719234 RepID=UPI00289745F9|nr:hypothetical protein [Lacrimispora sp.]
MEDQSSKDMKSPAQRIDERIEELGDWRGQMLSKVRSLILQADPEAVEECKWRETPGEPLTFTRERKWTRRRLRI